MSESDFRQGYWVISIKNNSQSVLAINRSHIHSWEPEKRQ